MSFKKDIFSYRWLVVGSSTLVMMSFYGTELSFGVFLKPLLEEFCWTRTMVSGALSTVEGIAGLIGILIGRLTDRYGARMLIAIGALIGGTGYLLLSRVDSLWQLYVYFGVIEGICISTCWVPLVATVSRWFEDKRILALGIITSGVTIGSMVLPPFIAYLTIAYGWRLAFIMLAVTVWIFASPGIIILGKKPPRSTGVPHHSGGKEDCIDDKTGNRIPSRELSLLEAIKTVPFGALMVTGFVTATGFYFLTVHIVAYADDVGIAATSAALIFTFMGGANILGKLLTWLIAMKVGNRYTLLFLLTLQAIGLFLLIQAKSLWMFFVLGSVFGFGLGGSTPIRMAMASEFFGIRSIGAIIGLLGVSWAAGGITGPLLAGYIFDLSHSYDIAFLAGGLLMIIGIVSTFFLKNPIKK